MIQIGVAQICGQLQSAQCPGVSYASSLFDRNPPCLCHLPRSELENHPLRSLALALGHSSVLDFDLLDQVFQAAEEVPSHLKIVVVDHSA